LGLGDFILVRLVDLELCLMGMGRAESEVVKDEKFDNFGHVHIQC
jgi:hypothetical protein